MRHKQHGNEYVQLTVRMLTSFNTIDLFFHSNFNINILFGTNKTILDIKHIRESNPAMSVSIHLTWLFPFEQYFHWLISYIF